MEVNKQILNYVVSLGTTTLVLNARWYKIWWALQSWTFGAAHVQMGANKIKIYRAYVLSFCWASRVVVNGHCVSWKSHWAQTRDFKNENAFFFQGIW